jgi:hypothetical protein
MRLVAHSWKLTATFAQMAAIIDFSILGSSGTVGVVGAVIGAVSFLTIFVTSATAKDFE